MSRLLAPSCIVAATGSSAGSCVGFAGLRSGMIGGLVRGVSNAAWGYCSYARVMSRKKCLKSDA